jgi:hypothetical protein
MKKIPLYVWCDEVEQFRHIAICMKNECECEKYLKKLEEIKKGGKDESRQADCL